MNIFWIIVNVTFIVIWILKIKIDYRAYNKNYRSKKPSNKTYFVTMIIELIIIGIIIYFHSTINFFFGLGFIIDCLINLFFLNYYYFKYSYEQGQLNNNQK